MAYTPATPGGSPDTWPAGSANPSPAYSGVFIPEIWAGKLIEKFYDATVLAAISNTDYEGEISSYGDKVNIRTIPDIAINEYSPEQVLTFERPSSALVELLIDKGYYFNTILDDVMEVQADLNLLSMWSDDSSEQMKIKIDTEVLAYLPTEVDAANQGLTAGAISGNLDLGAAGDTNVLEIVPRNPQAGEVEIVDAIVNLGQVLDEQNIPEQGRWLVAPAWFCAMIKRSELRDASLTGDGQSMLRNGRVGMIDRFELYVSNLLPTAVETSGDATSIMAGHKTGFTFASQLSKVETLRAESTFGTIMRGLQVYGRKTINGAALTTLYARKSIQ